jgi:hypothetical protein
VENTPAKPRRLKVEKVKDFRAYQDVYGNIHRSYEGALMENRKSALREEIRKVAAYSSLDVDQVVEHFAEWVELWNDVDD